MKPREQISPWLSYQPEEDVRIVVDGREITLAHYYDADQTGVMAPVMCEDNEHYHLELYKLDGQQIGEYRLLMKEDGSTYQVTANVCFELGEDETRAIEVVRSDREALPASVPGFVGERVITVELEGHPYELGHVLDTPQGNPYFVPHTLTMNDENCGCLQLLSCSIHDVDGMRTTNAEWFGTGFEGDMEHFSIFLTLDERFKPIELTFDSNEPPEIEKDERRWRENRATLREIQGAANTMLSYARSWRMKGCDTDEARERVIRSLQILDHAVTGRFYNTLDILTSVFHEPEDPCHHEEEQYPAKDVVRRLLEPSVLARSPERLLSDITSFIPAYLRDDEVEEAIRESERQGDHGVQMP